MSTPEMRSTSHRLPVVAIVGRPNVGKSTFFNRMIGRRSALTHNRAGVTRDRHYGEGDYLGRRFTLIDTGGFEPDADARDVYTQVKDQAVLAIEEADVVLLFFDARQGLVAGDYELIEMLRGSDRPLLHVVNKVETDAQQADVFEFYQLGIDMLYPISSEHALGLDALLEALLELLPPIPEDQESPPSLASEVADSEDDLWEALAELGDREVLEGRELVRRRRLARTSSNQPIRVALVGRPNVGKSSLANRILGQDRQVIHPEAGTTRDSIDIPFERDGRSYVLVDTAGVRRKSRISDKLEQFTVVKAFRAIDGCDVALLLLDSDEGVTGQEQRLAGLIEEKGRAVAVLVNKWDLQKGRGMEQHPYAESILMQLEHIRYAPVHFLSALTGRGVQGILSLVDRISEAHRKEVSTREFNEFLYHATAAHAPPMYKHHPVRLLYGVQVRTEPPTFLIFSNSPEGIRPDYRRYLVNRFRESFGFVGSPVHLVFRAKKRS